MERENVMHRLQLRRSRLDLLCSWSLSYMYVALVQCLLSPCCSCLGQKWYRAITIPGNYWFAVIKNVARWLLLCVVQIMTNRLKMMTDQCLSATLLQFSCLRTFNSHSSSFMGNRSFSPLHGSEYLCPPRHHITFSLQWTCYCKIELETQERTDDCAIRAG